MDENSNQSGRIVLNGPRPSPLRLHKDSHTIQKPKLNTPRKHPVIIYTYSPKIIHTKPKDFMALVQRLTGFTRPDDHDKGHNNKKSEKSMMISSSHGHDQDNDSSSVTSDDHMNAARDEMSPVPKGLKTHAYLTDFPLFTPNSNSLFSASPQGLFRHPDAVFTLPNVSLSPSFVEFIKGLPQY